MRQSSTKIRPIFLTFCFTSNFLWIFASRLSSPSLTFLPLHLSDTPILFLFLHPPLSFRFFISLSLSLFDYLMLSLFLSPRQGLREGRLRGAPSPSVFREFSAAVPQVSLAALLHQPVVQKPLE